MSIWSTQLSIAIPNRDQYGRETTPATPRFHTDDHGTVNDREMEPGEAYVHVCHSGMSNVIRLTVAEQRHDRTIEAEALITPDEARQIAAQLIASADYTESP